MKKVQISEALLRELLSEIEDSARILYSRYDRKSGTYPWGDKIWRDADPHRFKMVKKAYRALTGEK